VSGTRDHIPAGSPYLDRKRRRPDHDAGADWPSGPHAGYETTAVRVPSTDGDLLGTVRAAVARTASQRYRGLSDADSLPGDGGILFVYGSSAERTFVVRRPDFGTDIVYADGEGAIGSVNHAPEPGPGESGTDRRDPGSGQSVLEVPYRWTARHGVGTGDALAFDQSSRE
jgi:uncharacterized membrane protein (UPF0127 family)